MMQTQGKVFISVVTPCYNEQSNILELYERIRNVFQKMEGVSFEHIFIDNASSDDSINIVKSIINKDKNVRLITNARNFCYTHLCKSKSL